MQPSTQINNNISHDENITKELLDKFTQHLTQELIDIYLEKNLISLEQHEAGIYFSSLHRKRFGGQMLYSYDYSHNGGRELEQKTTDTIIQKEKLYEASIKELKKSQLQKEIVNLCLFNQAPRNIDISKIRDGLTLLYKFYAKNR